MARARKRYSPDEIRKIMLLHEEGYTYPQIAAKIRPGVPSAWRSVGGIVRRIKGGEAPTTEKQPSQPAPTNGASRGKVINTPTQSVTSRVELPDSIAESLTAREIMLMLDDDQRSLWVATYEDLRGEADDEQLTKAENEMLMRAAHSHVKYLRAQYMISLSESYMMMELNGELGEGPEDMMKRRLGSSGERYKKDAEQCHKEYMDLLEGLKLTRKQRLDKIKDTRNTFLDLQQELTSKLKQESLIEDIKRINLATEDELRRMAKGEPGPDGQVHPWLIGAFEDIIGHAQNEEENVKKD